MKWFSTTADRCLTVPSRFRAASEVLLSRRRPLRHRLDDALRLVFAASLIQENDETAKHRQVLVCNCEVDEGMAELLPLIWGHGMETYNSCQEGRPGIAWIEFASAEDFNQFLDLVAVYPDESELDETPFWETLYGRITDHGSRGAWTYDMYPHNYGVEEDIVNDEVISTFTGRNEFDISVAVRFPISDIPELTWLLFQQL